MENHSHNCSFSVTFNSKKINVKIPTKHLRRKKATIHSTWFHLLYKCDCWNLVAIRMIVSMWCGGHRNHLFLPLLLQALQLMAICCTSPTAQDVPALQLMFILCTTKKNIFDQFNWRYLLWRPFIPELVRGKLHHRNSASKNTLKMAKFDHFWNFFE